MSCPIRKPKRFSSLPNEIIDKIVKNLDASFPPKRLQTSSIDYHHLHLDNIDFKMHKNHIELALDDFKITYKCDGIWTSIQKKSAFSGPKLTTVYGNWMGIAIRELNFISTFFRIDEFHFTCLQYANSTKFFKYLFETFEPSSISTAVAHINVLHSNHAQEILSFFQPKQLCEIELKSLSDKKIDESIFETVQWKEAVSIGVRAFGLIHSSDLNFFEKLKYFNLKLASICVPELITLRNALAKSPKFEDGRIRRAGKWFKEEEAEQLIRVMCPDDEPDPENEISMPIGLLRLPSLVQREVLHEIDYNELFLLSVCSTRTRTIIHQAFLKPEIVRFTVDNNSINVAIGLDSKYCSSTHLVLLKWVEYIPEDQVSKMRIMGLEVEYRFVKEKVLPYLEYLETTQLNFLKTFQSHVDSLWRNSPIVQLKIESIHALIRCRHLRNVRDMMIKYENLHVDMLNGILELHPNLKSLHIWATLVGNLNRDSKLLKIKHLWVHQALEMSSTILTNFTGQTLFLRDAKLDINDMKDMIMKWKSMKAYRNLQELSVRLARYDFQWSRLIGEIDATPRGFVKLPTWYIVKHRIMGFNYTAANEQNVTDFNDIQQNVVVGKTASLILSFVHAHLIVWD